MSIHVCAWCGFRLGGHAFNCVHRRTAEDIAPAPAVDWQARALAAEARLADLERTAACAEDMRDAAEAALREVEYGADDGRCPFCFGRGHAPYCRLRAVLGDEHA